MTNSNETTAQQSHEIAGLGHVFCNPDDDEEMNVAALLAYLRGLRRAGKKIDLLHFALAEAQVLHDSGNDTID